jgi:hypothetical protein
VAGALRDPRPLVCLLQAALEPPPAAAALPWCQPPQARLDATLLDLLAAVMARAVPGLSSDVAVSGAPSPAPGLSLAQWSRLMGATVVKHRGALALVERNLERSLQVRCGAALGPRRAAAGADAAAVRCGAMRRLGGG